MANANTASLNDITCSNFMSGEKNSCAHYLSDLSSLPLYQLLPILLSFIREKAERFVYFFLNIQTYAKELLEICL